MRKNDFIAILLQVVGEEKTPTKWAGQPMEKVKLMPPTNVGNVGETYVYTLLQNLGYSAQRPESRRGQYDIFVPPNHKIEVKTATEDKSGSFQFNGIRYDTKYSWLLVLGISPADIYFKVYAKADLVTGKAGTLVPMRKGANSDFKLTKPPKHLHSIEKFPALVADIMDRP